MTVFRSDAVVDLTQTAGGFWHVSAHSRKSKRTMEQRQVDWSEIATKIERDMGHSYPFADGEK